MLILSLYLTDELIYLFLIEGVDLDLILHRLYRIHHGGSVTFEYITDLSEAHVGELMYQVYTFVSCKGNGLGSLAALDILNGNSVSLGDYIEYSLNRDILPGIVGYHIRYCVLCHLKGDGSICKEALGTDTVDCTLKLSYV